MDFTAIKVLILDVDGVLTDGRLFPVWTVSGPGGFEASSVDAKTFHVHDGCAIKLWGRTGGRTAMLSGRGGAFVENRARETGVDWCRVSVTDKGAALSEIVRLADCREANVAYVGDDLPDLAAMVRCAFPVAVAGAVPAVKRRAAYVTRRQGGRGAVAEVVELILRKQRRWSEDLLRTA
jgi:3-deoxy-D-manno-octulosonate 8-phosphate phosphatase (KDO 8-P phosphatase)